MSKFNKKKNTRVIHQANTATLIARLLQQPFDVSMACLIVLVDCDPTISDLRVVREFMGALSPAEQEYAAALEVALQTNKINKSRMQTALDCYFMEVGERVQMAEASQSEGFTAWLPGYNARIQQQWRDEHPEEAAALDAQKAQLATLDQGVSMLQATDPQGDVSELIPDPHAAAKDHIARNPDAFDPV